MNFQLRVELGMRVKIVIPAENLAYGCDKVYPQGGTGTVVRDEKGEYYDSYGKLAYVKLDKPFLRTGGGVNKPVRMTHMWVPTWLLVELKEEPSKLDMSELIRQVEHYDPDDVPYELDKVDRVQS